MANRSIVTSKPFYPRERSFWLCHIGGWSLLLIGIYFEYLFNRGASLGVELTLALVAGFILFAGGTYTGLLFRQWYYQTRRYEGTFLQTLPRVLLLSLISSIVICGVLILAAILILGHVPDRIVTELGTPFLVLSLINQALALFPFVVGWCLLYLLIKGTQNSRAFSRRALELENSLKEAKLNALAGQINPHFLFNALNNIRFMIHEDANRADESLISLSEILRHSMDSSKRDKIELAQELDIVRQYLELMKNQMGDRLTYSIQSDASLDSFLIPPMIMQMLAENAIKHAIDQLKSGGSITIDCSQVKDSLLIRVHNTGSFNDSSPDSSGGKGGTGIGLANIRKRLSLLYGEQANLSLAQLDGQVVVTIELPVERSNEISAEMTL